MRPRHPAVADTAKVASSRDLVPLRLNIRLVRFQSRPKTLFVVGDHVCPLTGRVSHKP